MRSNWVHILILASKVECSDTYSMHVTIFEVLFAFHKAQESVKEGNCEEPRPLRTAELGADLDHPVYHFDSVVISDRMATKGIEFGEMLHSSLLHEEAIDD